MIDSPRRYYLLKAAAAAAEDPKGMADVWRGKQAAEPGTALSLGFPYRSRLVAAGYSTTEDLAGASVDELRGVGFRAAEANAILAAIA